MSALSVVLISRNQEWNIARLIESVLRETAFVPETEIVLVDSASTDQTAEVAARYPVKVLKLRPGQHLSASAGRYVGYHQTSGDLVLFLDGDMQLLAGWLPQALYVLGSREDVAAVCGQVIDRPVAAFTAGEAVPAPPPSSSGTAQEVLHGGGAALYRRRVLEQVGTFNPFLFSDEEPELCLRIRRAGHRILRLGCPIAYHYTVPWEDLHTFLSKRKAKIWLGYGQNLRYLAGSPLLWAYLKERGWVVAPALMLAAGLLALIVSALAGQWGWLAVWAVLVLLLAAGVAIRKRSLKRAFLILFRRLLILDGTLRGLLLKPHPPAAYPAKFDRVR